jgi:hypothetical protein
MFEMVACEFQFFKLSSLETLKTESQSVECYSLGDINVHLLCLNSIFYSLLQCDHGREFHV